MLDLDISLSSILAGLIFGVIGLPIFRHGKKQSDMTLVLIGIALMIYPYFVSGPWLEWGVGFALCGAAYHFWV